MYLTFTTEAYANEALAQINTNYGYPIVGINARTGKPQPDKRLTTKWDDVSKAHELDKWYFQKPDESKMAGVVNHTQEEFNDAWISPPEI